MWVRSGRGLAHRSVTNQDRRNRRVLGNIPQNVKRQPPNLTQLLLSQVHMVAARRDDVAPHKVRAYGAPRGGQGSCRPQSIDQRLALAHLYTLDEGFRTAALEEVHVSVRV